MWAAIAASWSARSWSAAALFAAASAAACCLLCSLAARLSKWVCSSSSVDGRLLCPVRCSVRSLACFPLSGSSLSRSCSISGVSGIGSLPLLMRALECVPEAPNSEPKDNRSLSLSFEPLPCSAIGPNLFCSGTPVPVGIASGALLALLVLVAIVSHVLRAGHYAPKLIRVGTVGAGV
jgi:hypothetical protein